MGNLEPVELTVGGNEASDLLPVHAAEVLDSYGWRRAFWTVLDEGSVEHSIALLGERESGRWDAHLLAAEVPPAVAGRTEDAEALAHRDGYIYVIGSHFGSKRGPLKAKRAFVARFREADAAAAHACHLDVARNQFRLHRAVNDALRASTVESLRPGVGVRDRFITETISRGTAKAKPWVGRIAVHDRPVNVEAAAFTPAGTLLLGLRYPVSDTGEPLLVELSDVESLFDADESTLPEVRAVWVLDGVTPPGTLTGMRALCARGDGTYDAVVGSIDALGKDSVLLADHPAGGDVTCRHVRFRLPGDGPRVPAEMVLELTGFHNVEGVATVDGAAYYVTDEDHRIAIWRYPLTAA